MTANSSADTRARFTFVRQLVGGGMGEVWLARDEVLDRLVALKSVRNDAHGDVRREARALAALRHPNIVGVHDVVEVDRQQYLVMEFVDGPTLAERLAEHGRLPEVEVRRIGRELASALACAHEHEVLHNDIKPSNVLIDAGGAAHLTDFGVARVERVTRSLDATSGLMGTIAYLAPELFDGAAPSAATDIYALGVTLFEATAGQLPFGSGAAGVGQRLARPAPSLGGLVPGVTSRFDAAISRALSADPQQRFATAAQFAAALAPVDATQRIAVTPTPTATRTRRRPRRLVPVALGIAAAALTVGAFAWSRYDSGGTEAGTALPGIAQQGATAPPATQTTPEPTRSAAAASPATTTRVIATPTPKSVRVVTGPPPNPHEKGRRREQD